MRIRLLLLGILVMCGLSALTVTAKAVSAQEAIRIKSQSTKRFDPATFGSQKVANTNLAAAKRPYQRTWCFFNGKSATPGFTIRPASAKKTIYISYSQLAKNYRRATNGSSTSAKQKAAYGHLAKSYKKMAAATSPQSKACKVVAASHAPLRFSIANAIGVAKATTVARRGSHPSVRDTAGTLEAILADGSVRNAVLSGQALIDRIAISPSGQLVLVFSHPMDLETGEQYVVGGCWLVTVDRASGVPSCIDRTFSGTFGGTETFQFDATGGIYYGGTACDLPCTGWSRNVVRRYKNGTLTDLISDPSFVMSEYKVAPNGSVVILGNSGNAMARFIVAIAADGTSQDLPPPVSTDLGYLKAFADGNIYTYGTGGTIARLFTTTNTVDPAPWIGHTRDGATNSWDVLCATTGAGSGPCTGHDWSVPGGFTPPYSVQTTSGKNFIPSYSGIIQAFPSIASFTTPIHTPTMMASSGNNILIAGTSASEENLLVKFDSTTNVATTISSSASPTGEIEFFHLITSTGGYALFDGRRRSDNTNVIGKVDFSTGALEILSTGNARLVDFEAF